MNAAAAGGIGGGSIKGVAQCCWRCRRSPKLRSKLLLAVKQQSTTGETVTRHDLPYDNGDGNGGDDDNDGGGDSSGGNGQRTQLLPPSWYRGRRTMSSAVSTEPELALKIAIGGKTAVHNNRGDSCETRSALRQQRRQRRRRRRQWRWLQRRRQWTQLLPHSPYSLFPPCQRQWRRQRTEVPTRTTSMATTAVTMTMTAVATVGSLGGL